MRRTLVIIFAVVAMNVGHAYGQETTPNVSEVSVRVNDYLNNYVKPKVEKWQQKDEFETSVAYRARVTEATRDAKIKELKAEALNNIKDKMGKNVDWKHLSIEGNYDADANTFLIRSYIFGDIVLKVPLTDARSFKENFGSMQFSNPDFYFDNNALKLSKLTFRTKTGTTYVYDNKNSLSYNQITGDISGLTSIDEVIKKEDGGGPKPVMPTVLSSVDVDIPTSKVKNENTYVIIIANENYTESGVSKVKYALNDGKVFREYCIKTLGIPAERITYKPDATLNHIRSAVRDITNKSKSRKKYKEATNIIFYYSGHGTNDNNTAYLLPVDAPPNLEESSYKLDDLYKELGSCDAKNVLVFLDACYSGAGRDGKMLSDSKAVGVRVKQGVPIGNTVVIASSQGDQTSNPFDEQGHGLFTYYLLDKLKKSQGNVTLGDLSDSVQKDVELKSLDIKQKAQTPEVIPASDMSLTWREVRLK